MRRFLESNGSAVFLVFLVFLFLMITVYAFIMASTHSFAARCNRVYEPNTAANERCIARVQQGGPVFEENIGRI